MARGRGWALTLLWALAVKALVEALDRAKLRTCSGPRFEASGQQGTDGRLLDSSQLTDTVDGKAVMERVQFLARPRSLWDGDSPKRRRTSA